MITIHCDNLGRDREVRAGLNLGELAAELGVTLPYRIVGAAVNNKLRSLTYRVFQPKRVLFFDATHAEGRRMYIRSCIFMLYVSVRRVLPQVELEVLHSVSQGLYCELREEERLYVPTSSELQRLRDEMDRLRRAALTFRRLELPTEQVEELLTRLPDTAHLLRQRGDCYTPVFELDEERLCLFGDVVPSTDYVDVFELRAFFSGMLVVLPDAARPSELAVMTKQNKMFATFMDLDKTLGLLGIHRLADLNEAIREGQGARIIQVCEALHEKKIAEIADRISERRGQVRVVLIAGPSSSGKTTFSKRLATQLVLNGLMPVNLSIDNYFVNRDQTPRDEHGEYDFEAVEAIDVKLFNEQLLALIDGQEIEIPKYNFKRGEREYDGERLQLRRNSVIVIEGTHGLTPALTPMVPDEAKFKVYVAPLAGINFDTLTRISTTDDRLIRRIVRDYYTRGHNAEATINMWPSVRRGEDRFIYTNQEEADVMFNSCLLYELAVLRSKVEPILLEVKQNSPAFGEARRLLNFMSYVTPLSADTVPPTSLMREFLGGSSFVYD